MTRSLICVAVLLLAGHAAAQDVEPPPPSHAPPPPPGETEPDAQAPSDVRCREFAIARELPSAQDDGYACTDLATVLLTAIREGGEAPVVTPWTPEAPGGSGTPAQLAAAPAATPVPLAAGAISAVGSPGGPLAVAAVSLNPATVFQIASDEGSSRDISFSSRFVDVSVVLPFSLEPMAGDENPLDFFGVRMRVNAYADPSAAQAVALARELRQEAANQGIAQTTIAELLSHADDVQGCYEAIETLAEERMERACGKTIPAAWRNTDSDLREIEAAIRRDADRLYLGADLRFDYGDTAQTGDPDAADASTLLAAIAFGIRFVNEPSFLMRLRTRIGVQYSHVPVDGVNLNAVSLDGAGALEVEIPLAGDLLRASLGLEGRGVVDENEDAGTQAADITKTDYLDLRLGFVLPVAEGTGLGVDVSFPLLGDGGVQVGVSGDFSLLLPSSMR